MAMLRFKNNAVSTLAAGISNSATTLTVASGHGGKFPELYAGDWFLLTLYTKTGVTESNWEIVKCTARSTDSLTIVRAQEGTTAQTWATGTPVELRFTAGSAQLGEVGYSVSTAANIATAQKALGLNLMGAASATLGAEKALNPTLSSSASWSFGTGWSYSTGAQHTAGYTATLSQSAISVSYLAVYQIVVSMTGRTTGSVVVSFAGRTAHGSVVGTMTLGVVSATSGSTSVVITPSSDFNGKITRVSIKQLTARGMTFTLQSDTFDNTWVGRTTGIGNVLLGGIDCGGGYLMGGSDNVSLGTTALKNLVNGSGNVAMGSYALSENTNGMSNTAIGYYSGNGVSNTLVGANAGASITLANYNTCLGSNAGLNTQTGQYNLAVGFDGLKANVAGSNNVAVGALAGILVTGSYNTFIGVNAGSQATTGERNVIVGENCQLANASGSAQLCIQNIIYGMGNSGTGSTVSTGRILIGQTADDGQTRLQVAGDLALTGPSNLYLGNRNSDNTWAFAVSGADLLLYRLIAGNWTLKHTFTG